MSALRRYLTISLHSNEWNEMTLLEQATLQADAIAELDAIIAELDDALQSAAEKPKAPVNWAPNEGMRHGSID